MVDVWALLLATCATLQLLQLLPVTNALNNGLALTPPLGWNSWNHFGWVNGLIVFFLCGEDKTALHAAFACIAHDLTAYAALLHGLAYHDGAA
jgi:hypothetical protein